MVFYLKSLDIYELCVFLPRSFLRFERLRKVASASNDKYFFEGAHQLTRSMRNQSLFSFHDYIMSNVTNQQKLFQ